MICRRCDKSFEGTGIICDAGAPARPSGVEEKASEEPCNRFYRFLAALLDFMILETIFACLVVLSRMGDWAGTESVVVGAEARVIWGALALFYYLSFEYLVRATPGKMLLGQSVRSESGGPPSVLQVAGRYFGRLMFLPLVIPLVFFLFRGQLGPAMMFMVLTVVVCSVSNAMYLFTKNHQALHDIVSRCVIKQAVDISMLRVILSILLLVASVTSYCYVFRHGIKLGVTIRQKNGEAYGLNWNSRRWKELFKADDRGL